MSGGRIRIALIGMGKIARDQHVRAIAEQPQFELVAVADPLAEPLNGIPHFTELEALLADGPAFSAVTLCTPPQIRHVLAMRAIAAGRHVFLEKPPGATVLDVVALEQAANAAGVTLLTGWHSRFAGGVEPARAWLANRKILWVEIIWREDVTVWHPGQAWIWRPGGLGVFDPGINALSIATHILPAPLRLIEARLDVPENVTMPIAADLHLEGGLGFPIHMDLNFRQVGPQSWDIVVETDAGTLKLSRGGAELSLPEGGSHYEDREYSGLYAHFSRLIGERRSDVDARPLQLVADAFLIGRRTAVAPFYDP